MTDEDPHIARVLVGESVVANVGRRSPDRDLVEWAKQRGLLVYVGNRGRRHEWPRSMWGNPFKIGKHGAPIATRSSRPIASTSSTRRH